MEARQQIARKAGRAPRHKEFQRRRRSDRAPGERESDGGTGGWMM